MTLFGTGVCQHVLNGVTFVLLQKGRAVSAVDVGRYVGGGLQGTVGSGLYVVAHVFKGPPPPV